MNATQRGWMRGAALPCVLGLVFAPGAMGYVITFTGNAPTAPEVNPPPWSDTISLSRFNVPDSTLLIVELVLTAGLQLDVMLENTSTSGTSVINYSRGAQITFDYPVSATTQLTPTVNITTPVLQVYDGVSDGLGVSGITYNNVTASANTTITIPAGDWSAYTGAGSVTINVGAILGTEVVTQTGGKTTWDDYAEALASAEVTVRYTYSLLYEVPEGEALLGGMGLVGLIAGWRWRQMRRG